MVRMRMPAAFLKYQSPSYTPRSNGAFGSLLTFAQMCHDPAYLNCPEEQAVSLSFELVVIYSNARMRLICLQFTFFHEMSWEGPLYMQKTCQAVDHSEILWLTRQMSGLGLCFASFELANRSVALRRSLCFVADLYTALLVQFMSVGVCLQGSSKMDQTNCWDDFLPSESSGVYARSTVIPSESCTGKCFPFCRHLRRGWRGVCKNSRCTFWPLSASPCTTKTWKWHWEARTIGLSTICGIMMLSGMHANSCSFLLTSSRSNLRQSSAFCSMRWMGSDLIGPNIEADWPIPPTG